MGGALLELVAVGKQDTHLIGNPQFSYFKSVFKRHTNFSMESIGQPFRESVEFGKKSTCIISRKADMVNQMILELELPALQSGVSWINGIGHTMIKTIEIEIGGEVIDRHTGEYLDIFSELTLPNSKKDGYYKMIGEKKFYTKSSQEGALKLYIPLRFWFCKNVGSALPLISMQYSEVKVNVEMRPFNECWYSGTTMETTPVPKRITNAILYCDFIYLDVPERRKFATAQHHHYLIEQVQLSSGNRVLANSRSAVVDFHFNHPVKELFWVYQATDTLLTNDWTNYSNTLNNDQALDTSEEPFDKIELKLNGTDRFEQRDASYFRLVQPYQRHTAISEKYIYCYSFSLEPEKYQPSGTINFSRIDSSTIVAQMVSDIKHGEIRLYAVNYNILKIKSGMAGLLYSG